MSVASFVAPVRACMLPNGLTGPRLRRPPPPIRSDDSCQLCQISRRNIVSIGIGLSITTLLLVVFAYHGGSGGNSWFYSLLVVISVLAFVFFGPLLLCLCYYRQMQARSLAAALREIRVESGTQTAVTTTGMRSTRSSPRVYACIIIAPDAEVEESDCRFSDLPAYEEALLHSKPIGRSSSLSDDFSENPPTYCEALELIEATGLRRDENGIQTATNTSFSTRDSSVVLNPMENDQLTTREGSGIFHKLPDTFSQVTGYARCRRLRL